MTLAAMKGGLPGKRWTFIERVSGPWIPSITYRKIEALSKMFI